MEVIENKGANLQEGLRITQRRVHAVRGRGQGVSVGRQGFRVRREKLERRDKGVILKGKEAGRRRHMRLSAAVRGSR